MHLRSFTRVETKNIQVLSLSHSTIFHVTVGLQGSGLRYYIRNMSEANEPSMHYASATSFSSWHPYSLLQVTAVTISSCNDIRMLTAVTQGR